MFLHAVDQEWLSGELFAGLEVEGNGEDAVGAGGYVVGVVVAELLLGPEAPGDAYGGDAGAAGGDHVNTRIAHVEHLPLGGGTF